MRRSLLVRIAALPIITVLAACSIIQPPISTTIRPALTSSNTPVLQVIVTRGTPDRTVPPTWTPHPSVTPAPTFTKGPTATLRSTATPLPSATIVGGKPGILTTEGLLAIEVTDKEINSALAEARDSVYFSSSINFAPTVSLSEAGIKVSINFNDHSQAGLVADVSLLLLAGGNEVAATIVNYKIQNPSIQLSGQQTQIIRDIMRAAFARVLPPRIKPFAPDLRSYQVMGVSVNTDHVLVTLKVTQATLSPGEFTATAAASITP